MKNKRERKVKKGGLYIVLSCCALVIAAVGYVGSEQDNNSNINKKNQLSKVITSEDIPNYPKIDVDYENDDIEKEKTNSTVTIYESDTEIVKEENIVLDEVVQSSNSVSVEEFQILMPVDGSVITSFSNGEFAYNEILGDWRTHNGIDISCNKDSAIYAACDGEVEEIYSDSMGRCVKIAHSDGYKTIYANLSDTIEVMEGDKVVAGDLIGKVGDSAVADFTTDPHLHFELMCDDKYLDPVNYIKE